MRIGEGRDAGAAVLDARPDTESPRAATPDAGRARTLAARRGPSPSLDVMRGLAALGVVAFHFAALAKILGYSIPFWRAGETGVQLFFVLSGYLITRSVLSASYTPRSYVVNRVFRILPAYYFAIVLALFVGTTATISTGRDLIGNLGTHAILVHNVSHAYRTSIISVLWTLSLEWMFYVFMLVVAGWIRRPRAAWTIAILMVVLAVVYRLFVWHRYAGSASDLNFYSKQFPGMMDEFACGMIVALLERLPAVRRVIRQRDTKMIGLVLSVLFLALAAAEWDTYSPSRFGTPYWHHEMLILFWPLFFCGAAAGVVLFVQQFDGRIGPWLTRSRLTVLGTVSYSLYLLHTLVIGSVARGVQSSPHPMSAWAYTVLTVLGIAALAGCSYLFVERPFMNMRARFTKPRVAPTA